MTKLKYIEAICISLIFLAFFGMVVLSVGLKALSKIGIEFNWSNHLIESLEWNVGEVKDASLKNKVTAYEEAIEELFISSCVGREKIHTIVHKYKEEVLNINLYDAVGISRECEVYCNNISELEDYLEERNIHFLYVQTPSKKRIEYESNNGVTGDAIAILKSIYLKNQLKNQDITVLDIYEVLGNEYQYSYDNSGHWYSVDALNTTREIAIFLNEYYNFEFDLKQFEIQNYYNILEEYPEFRQEILDMLGYEYEFLIPKSLGKYKLVRTENENWQGSFQETFLKKRGQWYSEKSAYHRMLNIENLPRYCISNLNENVDNNRKILFISDSFNWPIVSYMALGVAQIDVIYNENFGGSIEEYVEETNPDLVIVCYNDTQFLRDCYEVYNFK